MTICHYINKPFLQVGNMVYVSGHGPVKEDNSQIIGRVGKDMDMEEAKNFKPFIVFPDEETNLLK